MPLAPTYIDTFKVRNKLQTVLTLGDLVNLSLEPGVVTDILKISRVTKSKINQSRDLKMAIDNGWVQVILPKVVTPTEKTILDNLYCTDDDTPTVYDVVDIAFIIDGGGAAIVAGIKGDLEIPFPCTINQVTLLADQAGTIVVDIWKDVFANYPPTVADSITAAAKPTLAGDISYQDATLTGWTTSIAAGDTLRINVEAGVALVQRVLISLKATRTN